MKLKLSISTCPNDTFMFDAMLHRRIDTEGLDFDLTMADIEQLNAAALAGKLLVHTLFTVTSYGVTRIIPALITPSTETARIAAAQRRPTLRCTRGAQSFSRSICKT